MVNQVTGHSRYNLCVSHQINLSVDILVSALAIVPMYTDFLRAKNHCPVFYTIKNFSARFRYVRESAFMHSSYTSIVKPESNRYTVDTPMILL